MLRRGTRGMDAERGAMGQGWPFATTPGAAPERGEFCEASRGRLVRMQGWPSFWLLFLRLEKVTRPAGRNQCLSQLSHRV